MSHGNFAFEGLQRNASYGCFHADTIPNSVDAASCPNLHCSMFFLQNDPASSGNVIYGSDRLAYVGNGIVLEPGDVTGWIPANNLGLLWHKESDVTTYLNYCAIVSCSESTAIPFHILLEDGGYLLLETGDRIYL